MKKATILLNIAIIISINTVSMQASEGQEKTNFSVPQHKTRLVGISLMALGSTLTTFARSKVPFSTNTQRSNMLQTLNQQEEKGITNYEEVDESNHEIYINRSNPLKTPIYEINYNSDSITNTIELHGFGDHPENHKDDYCRENQENKKKRTLVCFEEAEKNRFLQTSLGSGRDIDVAIIGLANIVDNDRFSEKIIIEAISRGCNPAIEALAEIIKHQNSGIRRLGVSAWSCKEIIKQVENGGMILTVPMKSRAAVLNHLFGSISGPIVDKILLPWGTLRCKPWDKQAIDRIKELKGLKINTAIFYAKDDQVVGNKLDEVFTQEFKNAFGEDKVTDHTILVNYQDKHNGIHYCNNYVNQKNNFQEQLNTN